MTEAKFINAITAASSCSEALRVQKEQLVPFGRAELQQRQPLLALFPIFPFIVPYPSSHLSIFSFFPSSPDTANVRQGTK